MLTRRQIEILEMCIDGVRLYRLEGTDRGVILYLESEGLCYTKALSDPIYQITQKGRAALEEAYQAAEQKAKDERQQRFDNKISIANVLVPLVTFLLGLVIEHYTGIVRLVLSLFH